MDARPDMLATTDVDATRSCIDPADLRSILCNLSHELCRPLISLRAGFDLLVCDTVRPLSPDQRGHVQSMAVICDDLLRLTRSYLDYAGLVEGTRPLSFGTFTVRALIREIDRQFAATAQSRRIGWRCALDGPDATVTTDASRCQQIFGNVVANALKYTPEGGDVRVAGRVAGRNWVVTVSDDGPGIPSEHLGDVLEPFFRLPRDEQARVEGNGLGLAICREMVHQLAGEIALHSAAGQGTRVTLRFPIEPAERSSPSLRPR
jgi:signal transduction histidine kinase